MRLDSLCSKKLQKVAEIKKRDAEWCHEWLIDQLRSDGRRLYSDLPRKSERSSLQHLTLSLKEDNDGWESSSHKAALLAHRGRCGDVVTGKVGCVSKQELPALCIAAQAPLSVILLSFSSYLSTDYCLSVPTAFPTFFFTSWFSFFFLSFFDLYNSFLYSVWNNKDKLHTKQICWIHVVK